MIRTLTCYTQYLVSSFCSTTLQMIVATQMNAKSKSKKEHIEMRMSDSTTAFCPTLLIVHVHVY